LKQTQRIEPSCALARANRVFRTDEKRIRTENTVMDKSKGGLGWLLPKIADGARMRFSSVRNRRSARTGRRPRKFERHSSKYRPTSANVTERSLRAPRANRVFGTDMKRIRTKNTVMDKSKGGLRWNGFCKIVKYRHQFQ
jgi:hypothetical protein